MTSVSGQSNNIPWATQRRRLLAMLETFEPAQVADMARVPLGIVMQAQKERPPSERWVAVNAKTGSKIVGRSERAAYRNVMLLGWTEWNWETEGKLT